MFLAHSIRLRDPWQCEPTPDGGLRWRRLFHRPTGLEPDDSLVLVISSLPPEAAVTINGLTCATGMSPVRTAEQSTTTPAVDSPAASPFRFDVTKILADANQIEITVPPAARPGESPVAAGGLAPPNAFPYDARLAIVGHS